MPIYNSINNHIFISSLLFLNALNLQFSTLLDCKMQSHLHFENPPGRQTQRLQSPSRTTSATLAQPSPRISLQRLTRYALGDADPIPVSYASKMQRRPSTETFPFPLDIPTMVPNAVELSPHDIISRSASLCRQEKKPVHCRHGDTGLLFNSTASPLLTHPARRPALDVLPIRCMAAVFLFLLAWDATSAPGIPKLVPLSSPSANTASSGQPTTDWSNTPPDTLIATLRGKLAAANEAIAQAKGQIGRMPSTAVATQTEIMESEYLQGQMIRVYQRQIESLLQLKSLQQSRLDIEHEVANWTGMPTPPPYSFLVVDELREAVRFQNARILALTAMDAAIEQESTRRDEVFEEAGEKLRQANERLENQAGQTPRLVWLHDLAVLRNRLAESRIEGIRIEQRTSSEEMAETRQRLDFFKLKLNAIKSQIAFPTTDKAQVLDRLTTERQRIQAELEAAAPLVESSHQSLDAALSTLEQERKSQSPDSQRLADMESDFAVLREQTENTDIKFQMLNRLFDSVKMREKYWELRWSTAATNNREDLQQSYATIDKLQTELQPIRVYVEQRAKLTSEQVYDMDKQMLDPTPTPAMARELKLRDLFVEREAYYRRMLSGIDIGEHLLNLWKQDLDDRHQVEPLQQRAKEQWRQILGGLSQLWQIELFAAEDSIEVEGQTITGKRSITVGKVATALSILIVGLWISSRLTRFAERMAITRAGMDASSAHIARRWILFLIGAILVISSLVMVKIPLSVFTFAGGAVAIGAGFGMQNLLKNLISGLMLLLERPFRPGDLIEVGGIRGRVIDIGVRSSHIRDNNGIETLIPNSTFVEENVTNWTLSSQSVRIAVKLGVAYDSAVREVTNLLLETAGRHGLVQDDPAPQVLFEDFGSDALQFGLYVWVEIKPGVDWRVIASDLRYMLHKSLTGKGIVMAFPQRDIHLDTSQPLQVQLFRQTSSE